MIESITYFFTDPIASKVILGVAIIGAISGGVGTFSFLRKKTLIADAVSHSVLPGVCIGFMFAGTKDPILLMVGALFFGWFSVWLIDYISSYTKLSEDTAIALVSTLFFAFGSVLLSIISKSQNAEQTGLKNYLFGKAATMTSFDIEVFSIVSFVILLVVILFFKPFQLVCFNLEFAKSIGVKVRRIEFLLSTLTVLTVAIGIQAVGVVLMSALLIAPAASARYWTNKLPVMLIIAAVFGILSGVLGVMFSTIKDNMPTGPWVVFSLFLFTLFTLLLAPDKGWISIRKRNKSNRRKIAEENILKTIFQLKEDGKDEVSFRDFLEKRTMDTATLENNIKHLVRNGWLKENFQTFKLTEKGEIEAARIVRSHRLWELYLTKRMNFKDDHIHGTAETMEHLITPEIEKELLKELNFPISDPHNKEIPYV
jgi:manganese/zinc/iron transport system permease protein